MPKIHVLPESVANKIAAGEVIERPASVVKELLENALDAEATHIEVAVEDGGKRLIRVTDNGVGMDAEDLALAFASHATSKIATAEELFAIRTLGFRGEALASIASVSQARIVSRPRGAVSGAEVTASGGQISEVRAAGAAEGTTVEVRNLFFNLPVRRKFLKSDATELGHITEALTRAALCYPSVRFDLKHNGRPVFSLAPVSEPLGRVQEFFGEEVARSLRKIRRSVTGLEVSGYVAGPREARLNAKLQYIFLNGRYVRDRFIYAAISQAYQGLLMQRRFPVVFLFIAMNPSLVDVNVHPTKIEVRFRNPNQVFQEVREAISSAIRGPGVPPQSAESADAQAIAKPSPGVLKGFTGLGIETTAKPTDRQESIRRAMADFFAKSHNRPPSAVSAPQPPPGAVLPSPAPQTPSVARAELPRQIQAFQVHNSYIIEETAEGIQIIDQHALHERILREALESRLKQSSVVSQRLLIPVTVRLSAQEFLTVMELRSEMEKIGLEIAEFGRHTVAIHSAPQILGHYDLAQFLRDVLDEIKEEGKPTMGTRLERILNLAACKGAVKAGQPLSREEIQSLLRQRAQLSHPDICAHGRPSTILLTHDYLRRHFARR